MKRPRRSCAGSARSWPARTSSARRRWGCARAAESSPAGSRFRRRRARARARALACTRASAALVRSRRSSASGRGAVWRIASRPRPSSRNEDCVMGSKSTRRARRELQRVARRPPATRYRALRVRCGARRASPQARAMSVAFDAQGDTVPRRGPMIDLLAERRPPTRRSGARPVVEQLSRSTAFAPTSRSPSSETKCWILGVQLAHPASARAADLAETETAPGSRVDEAWQPRRCRRRSGALSPNQPTRASTMERPPACGRRPRAGLPDSGRHLSCCGEGGRANSWMIFTVVADRRRRLLLHVLRRALRPGAAPSRPNRSWLNPS